MRTALDPMDPAKLRSAFEAGFRQLQRGKAFEKMAFQDDHYLFSGDGIRKCRNSWCWVESAQLQKKQRETSLNWLSLLF